jgi:hypothetical protein
VARVLSTAFCVALLAATAGAFALTQGAKVELAPVYRTHVDKVFSPVCSCRTRTAQIAFRLRRSDRLTVWVERDGRQVRTLVTGRSSRPGTVALVFDGRDDAGAPLPDGAYRPVIRLEREHRTIELPNTIVLDTRPPVVRIGRRLVTHISPDGDGHRDIVRIRYALSEPAHGILTADGRPAVFTYRKPLSGVVVWNGRIAGRLVRPGRHLLRIAAQDVAGNRSAPIVAATVTVRYVALDRTRVAVAPGEPFTVVVRADRRARWLFDGARGLVEPGRLRLRAPARPGTYRLFVTVAGHAAAAEVVVAG